MLENVDEGRFRAFCRNALEGIASKKLNLEMLIERKDRRGSAASYRRPSPGSWVKPLSMRP
ncbi:MAG: hypothetical protein NTU83_04165 [Candidatus Hydrogenedentes bacterium]|nr:hypothetical protein [Candidatus Hydrogenedentota bacterium]